MFHTYIARTQTPLKMDGGGDMDNEKKRTEKNNKIEQDNIRVILFLDAFI